jgi:hypothetical protein
VVPLEADVVVVELLEELLPHAAISPLAASVATPSARRRERDLMGWERVICFLSDADQPVVPVLAVPVLLLPVVPAPVVLPLLAPPAPEPVARVPESLTEVAEIVPLELVAPWITTASPGRSDDFEAVWLFVTLVADESVTLTVLPEAWVT